MTAADTKRAVTMNGKQALKLADKLLNDFVDVIIRGAKDPIVVVAKGHKRLKPLRCVAQHNVHVGPILKATNITAFVGPNGFYHPKEDDTPPRKFSEVLFCKRCDSVLSFEVDAKSFRD